MRIIKKYKNRKLYDTEESQYISLEDIVELMEANKKIKIITHDKQEDITKNIMLQAMLKYDKLNFVKFIWGGNYGI